MHFYILSGSSISSISSRSETGSENASISDHSDTDSLLPCEQQKMTIQFLTDSHEISAMDEVYQPIINWIDPDLHVLKITDKSETLDNDFTSLPDVSARIPSMAVMVFLQEEGMVGFERIQTLKRYFEKSPWKFHHSEQVNRGAINPYPYNSQDFYYTSEDLPLWAVRQVHTGKEFFRTVLFVSESNWQSMMQFYKLILSCEPDVKRDDFCLFTVSSFSNFNIQLALKRLQGDTKPRTLDSVRLQFLVSDISNIVSLLPNVCRPLSDTRWETSDNDGNVVVLETPRIPSNSTFNDHCSVSDRSSLSDRNSFVKRSSFNQNRNRPETVLENNKDVAVYNQSRQRSSRRNATQNQRSKSCIGDDKILQKIKMDNMLYREHTIKAIKEKHVDMQKGSSHRHDVNDVNDVDNIENNNLSDIQKAESVKSFYV